MKVIKLRLPKEDNKITGNARTHVYLNSRYIREPVKAISQKNA